MSQGRIRRDVVSGVALVALSVAYFLGARGLPAGQDEPGPGFFPELLAGVLFVLAVTIITRARRQTHGDDMRTPVSLITLTAVYAATFTFVGFFAGTLVYASGMSWLLGQRGWRAVIVPVATTAAIYALLGIGLGVPLP